MSDTTSSQFWPSDWREAVLLLRVLIVLVFHVGRSASERLTVAVGAIRLHPATLVPMAGAETTPAIGLLAGAIKEYLAQSDEDPTA